MPQMAPLNWLTLFILFCITLMVFSSMNYWTITYTPKMTQNTKLTFLMNWKW